MRPPEPASVVSAPSSRRWTLLAPMLVVAGALGPRLARLAHELVDSYAYAYDSHTLLYLSDERLRSLLHPWRPFDFGWMHPYPNAGTYMDPVLLEGVLYGLARLVGLSEPAAFNAAMAVILVLNYAACAALLEELTGRRRRLTPWLASVAAFSPYAWSRFGAPTNTLLFPGLWALVLLLRATRTPDGRLIAGAALGVVLQAWSSLYVFMFFFVVGLGLGPALLAASARRNTLRAFGPRLAAGMVAAAPPLAWLWSAYARTRREMSAHDSFEYVSEYYPLTFHDLATPTPFDCRFAVWGVVRPASECGEQTFPGWMLVGLAFVVLVGSGLVWLRRWRAGFWSDRRRRPVPGLPVAGLAAALALGETWPLHLCLWTLLSLPSADGRGALLGRRPPAVAAALVLLVVDVALNPVVPLPLRPLGSIHRLLFDVIPGLGGVRSEYRIVLFLPVLLAVIAAAGLPRLTEAWPTPLRRLGFAVIVVGCVLESQPSWQGFFPTVGSGEPGPVLEAARALPDAAVLAVLKGEGAGIGAPTDADASYFDALSVHHRHRTVTGYSTFVPPGPAALRRTAALPDPSDRLVWTARLASMLGATHLLLVWMDGPAPPAVATVSSLAGLGRIVADDDRHLLVELPLPSSPPVTAFAPSSPGRRIPATPEASFPGDARLLVDEDVETSLTSAGVQKAGDWVRLSFAEPRRVDDLVLTPRYLLESLPYGWVVEVLDDTGSWVVVRERHGWSLPAELVSPPGTGPMSIPIRSAPTAAIRLRLLEDTPFSWALASFEARGT